MTRRSSLDITNVRTLHAKGESAGRSSASEGAKSGAVHSTGEMSLKTGEWQEGESEVASLVAK